MYIVTRMYVTHQLLEQDMPGIRRGYASAHAETTQVSHAEATQVSHAQAMRVAYTCFVIYKQ